MSDFHGDEKLRTPGWFEKPRKIVARVAGVFLAVLLPTGVSFAANPPPENVITVVGTWTAIDANDGSTGYLAVTAPKYNAKFGYQELTGAFADSEARTACTEGGGVGVPFTGTFAVPVDGFELNHQQDTEFLVSILGTCGKKRDEVGFTARVRYFGDTDTVRFLGNDWRRHELEPEVFEAGILELQGTASWVVSDLILDARERVMVNAICKIYATFRDPLPVNCEVDPSYPGCSEPQPWDPPVPFVTADHETSCTDGIDNDCDGLLDGEDLEYCAPPSGP